MQKDLNEYDLQSTLAVDINGLKKMLSCGEQTAKAIAEKANAQIPVSERRILYSVDKIRDYLRG